MGRRFLVGAAIALVVLLFGLHLESRMPDQAGPGEEIVEFHGICVYRQEIPQAAAAQHSPITALAVAVGVIAAGTLIAGTLTALLGRSWKRNAREIESL